MKKHAHLASLSPCGLSRHPDSNYPPALGEHSTLPLLTATTLLLLPLEVSPAVLTLLSSDRNKWKGPRAAFLHMFLTALGRKGSGAVLGTARAPTAEGSANLKGPCQWRSSLRCTETEAAPRWPSPWHSVLPLEVVLPVGLLLAESGRLKINVHAC